MNKPDNIEIRRTVETDKDVGDIVRYWVGSLAVMKDPEGHWGVYPDGTFAERPLFTAETLEKCFDMVQGAVALMQPAEGLEEGDPCTKCGEPMRWDAGERMLYCLNDYKHN